MDIKRLEGQRVGQFRLSRFKAAGGFGAVYVADPTVEGEVMGASMAVKVIDPEGQNLKDPLRELHNAAALRHSNLIEAIGYPGKDEVRDAAGASGAVLWIAMELADKSLRERIARSPLNEEETLALARDVAAGLRYLHGQGLVHRDIKPENILRVGGAWKLSDLGLTRREVTDYQYDHIAGAKNYLPPEHGDDRNPRVAWDVWAFGLTLVEAATGRHVRDERNERQWTHLLTSDEPIPLPALPDAVRELVSACVDKQPERRLNRWRDQKLTQTRGTGDAANELTPEEMCSLGDKYWRGVRVAQDYAEAMKWYRKAAEAGHVQSMTFLASMYRKGEGVPKDGAEAVRWYRNAVVAGHVDSMGELGLM